MSSTNSIPNTGAGFRGVKNGKKAEIELLDSIINYIVSRSPNAQSVSIDILPPKMNGLNVCQSTKQICTKIISNGIDRFIIANNITFMFGNSIKPYTTALEYKYGYKFPNLDNIKNSCDIVIYDIVYDKLLVIEMSYKEANGANATERLTHNLLFKLPLMKSDTNSPTNFNLVLFATGPFIGTLNNISTIEFQAFKWFVMRENNPESIFIYQNDLLGYLCNFFSI